jgi:chromosome segregation ATPase
MRHARRLDSQNKAALVIAATEAALTRAGHLSIAGVARDAGVGRKFIYDHPDLKAQIELKAIQATQRQANDMTSAARVSAASLRAELANSRAQNYRLNNQLRALETRLSQAEGARLVADNLLPDTMIAELADRQLAQRNTELEQQLFAAQEELRHAAEELDAARVINRELMQRANRSAADTAVPNTATAPTSHPKRRRPAE